MRPRSINDVEQNLLDLARLGGISWGNSHSVWLRSVGAVQEGSSHDWLYTDQNWLAAVEPATGPLDLLRRTAVLDSQYRFHLDLLVAQVLQTIGSAARWGRRPLAEVRCPPQPRSLEGGAVVRTTRVPQTAGVGGRFRPRGGCR